MPPDGGLRDRLIHENIFRAVKAELTTLGWFDPGREHQPLRMIDEFPDENQDVPFNTLAVSMGDAGGVPTELGSKLEDFEVIFFIDFFAENDGVGRHVRGDIAHFLKGAEMLPITDYSDPLEPVVFSVEIQDDIDLRKPERAVQKFQKHWYVLSFTVIDYGRPH